MVGNTSLQLLIVAEHLHKLAEQHPRVVFPGFQFRVYTQLLGFFWGQNQSVGFCVDSWVKHIGNSDHKMT